MSVVLDIEGLKEFIKMNQDAVNLNMPMGDAFKVRFMTQGRQILNNNYRHQVTDMSMMLQCFVSIGDSEELDVSRIIVREYQGWIFAELSSLDTIED